MPDNQTRLQYLFRQFVNDSATADELREFWQLMNELPENDPVKKDLWRHWHKTAEGKQAAAPDWDQSLRHIRFQADEWEGQPENEEEPPHEITRNQENKSGQSRHTTRRITWLAAASVVLLLVAGGVYLLRQQNTPPVVQAPAATQVVPGREGAILTLADGSTVVLDSLGNGVIATQNNAQLTLHNGRLAYAATEGAQSEAVYNTISTPRGRQFQIILPDGTKVWLNAASSLRYPTAFTGNKRKVELSGEAYFEVASDRSMPFSVNAAGVQVNVTGTHFNIMAYPDEKELQTTLLEGAVTMQKDNSSQALQPGQQAALAYGSSTFTVTRPNLALVLGWKEGEFRFRGTNIVGIMHQLSRWYDIEPVFKGDMSRKNFSGTISRQAAIQDVLNMLSLTEDIQFTTEGRQVTVTALH